MNIVNNVTEWKLAQRPKLMQLLRRHCVALWLIEYPDEQIQTGSTDFGICGGSAFLWQTNSAKYLVTAHHVWLEYRNRIKKRPGRNLIFYLDGDHAIPIFNFKIVSEDKDLDLAVLGGPGIESLKLNEKAFFKQSSYQTSEVLDGERLAILGYPKDLRISKMPYNTIGILYMQGAAIVSKYGKAIRVCGNPPHKFRSLAVPALEEFETPGISGGPVFALRDTGIDWVGIVSEAGGIAPHFDLAITPSKFINNDGKIYNPVTIP